MSEYEHLTVAPKIVEMSDNGYGTVIVYGVIKTHTGEIIGHFDTEVEGTLNPGEVDG